MTDRHPGGRPPGPPEERRTLRLSVPVTAAERARYLALTERLGVGLADLVRALLEREAQG